MGGFGRDGGGRDGGGRIGGGLDGASQDLRRTGSLYTTPARPYPLYKGCATALAWASVLSGGTRDMRARAVGMRSACAQHKCPPWAVPVDVLAFACWWRNGELLRYAACMFVPLSRNHTTKQVFRLSSLLAYRSRQTATLNCARVFSP